MRSSLLTGSLVGLFSAASATQQGFNYGSTDSSGACRVYEDFHNMFTQAQSIAEPGFTAARLYTNVQCGSTNAPIEAIKAAIDTQTNLLLGLWASSGQTTIDNEIIAMKTAAANWPAAMKLRVKGISVGSEDLYRASPQGQANNAGVGADAATITSYIKQVRAAIKGTALEGKPVGHVDTWTGWQDGDSASVVANVDFLGHNGFPYFETTRPSNAISACKTDFQAGLSVTEGIANGKPVWITETGWPSKGPKSGEAVANVANMQTYWKQVGCPLFGSRPTYWYTLYDSNTAQTDIAFAILNSAGEAKFGTKC